MPDPTTCRFCNKPVDPNDVYCKYCGNARDTAVPFTHTHAGMIILTLLLGPLALPFILKSQVISGKIRTAYIVFNLALTIVAIGSIFGIFNQINKQVQETMKVLRQSGIETLKPPEH